MQTLNTWNLSQHNIVKQCISETALSKLADELTDLVLSGKKIRSRLGYRLSSSLTFPDDDLIIYAAAVEMIHSASLLHDDVIDNADMRRGDSAFWIKKGVSGAILLGDLLICRTIKLISDKSSPEDFRVLLDFINQVCDAEAEQELLGNTVQLTFNESIDVARRKTGSLFAFIAYACGGTDPELKEALKESGYEVGIAFQLADDLYDRYGNVENAGKSLRNDVISQKVTTIMYKDENCHIKLIDDYCISSLKRLDQWPDVYNAWETFLCLDLKPAIEKFVRDYSVQNSKYEMVSNG